MTNLLNLDIPYPVYFNLLFKNKEHQEMARIEFEEDVREKEKIIDNRKEKD